MDDIKDVYAYLDKNEPNIATKICYASEMLLSELDNAIEALKDRRVEATKIDDDAEVDRLRDYRDMLKKYKNDINEYLNYATHHNRSEPPSNVYDSGVKRELPDYTQYTVNPDVPHMLDEDFTHKRPCAYMFSSKKKAVSSWQEILVSLCGQLSMNNRKLFESLVNDPRFSGKKINYFGTSPVTRKNKLVPGTRVYVWINMSAEQITRLIQKLLIAFDENPNEFYVYLRADYNDLHSGIDEIDEQEIAAEPEERVGKFVQRCMRELELAKHRFSTFELKLLQSKEWSNKTFGVNYPILCANEQELYDNGGRRRYYKETYTFNGVKFYLTSQWFDYNRDRFEKWFSTVK